MCGVFSLGLAISAHADLNLVLNGNFTSFTTTGPGVGNSEKLAANTLSDWVNNTQIPTAYEGNGGLGYNYVYTPDAGGNFNYSGGAKEMWNASNGGVDGFGQIPGYTGNIIGLDGAYQQGALTQTITGLTPGDIYHVDFDYAGAQQYTFTGNTTEALKVDLGNSPAQTTPVLHNQSHGFTGWYGETMTFTADSTSEVLSFLAVGTPDGEPPFSFLGDVSIVTAPEPSSVIGGSLVVLALGAGSIRKFRKQKQA